MSPSSSSLLPASPTDFASLTIVCCVEAGPLEQMTLRMIESLRRHGGRFAQAQVWAITPRYGPSLTPSTLKRFEELGAQHHIVKERSNYAWYNLWNKTVSMSYAEARAQSDYMAFIDSDIVITGEPTALVTGDFTARVHGTKHIATTGPGDEREEFWRQVCRVTGLELDDLPWVTPMVGSDKIRLYFNSGVFSYRRVTKFGQQWLEVCRRILDEGVGTHDSKNHFNEQVALGLTLVKSGLQWQELPDSHNYDLASWDAKEWKTDEEMIEFSKSIVVHYHDAMNPGFWPQFIQILRQTHPQVYQWIHTLGPVSDTSPRATRAMSKLLKTKRVIERNKYQAKMKLF